MVAGGIKTKNEFQCAYKYNTQIHISLAPHKIVQHNFHIIFVHVFKRI